MGGSSAFSAVPPKTAHDKAQPLDTNLFAPAGGDVGVSQGAPLNDLLAKGAPTSPPVDLFAAAQATPNAEEETSAVQQGAALETGWFKDEARRASGGSEKPSSVTPEPERFSSDSLEKASKDGSEKGGSERRGLYSADSLDKAAEGGLEKEEAEGGVREKSEAGDEETEGPVEQRGGVERAEDHNRTHEKRSAELEHAEDSEEKSKLADLAPQLASEKGVEHGAERAREGLAAVSAAAAGGVAIGGGLGDISSKQDSKTEPTRAVKTESSPDAVDRQPPPSLQKPARISQGLKDSSIMGGKEGAEGAALTTQNHVGAAEKSEFNDINFWKSSYGMSIAEDAL